MPMAHGRQWREAPAHSRLCQRRDEISRLAFLLLGGREAASRFLEAAAPDIGPDNGLTRLQAAMRSALGQMQVSAQLHKFAALNRPSPFQGRWT
ncbi:hypothetical protein ASE49_03245 [Novosphingobium sp. Leaf2]|nr:hypothetical protein ASE49_03245 [Novosphingobium sp. Leaf2]